MAMRLAAKHTPKAVGTTMPPQQRLEGLQALHVCTKTALF